MWQHCIALTSRDKKVSHYCQQTAEGFGRRLLPARYCGWLLYFPGRVKFLKKWSDYIKFTAKGQSIFSSLKLLLWQVHPLSKPSKQVTSISSTVRRSKLEAVQLPSTQISHLNLTPRVITWNSLLIIHTCFCYNVWLSTTFHFESNRVTRPNIAVQLITMLFCILKVSAKNLNSELANVN